MLLPQLLLIGAVVAVGVLHTIVPDHWVPITLVARAQGWSTRETALAALKAGTGHVVSTLVIGAIVWIAGAAFAARFGNIVSIASSLALIGFGAWIGIGALRELRGEHVHGHGHSHDHGPEDGHEHKTSSRTALLLILGSSPMVEGIPAFFAAGKYGFGLIAIMSIAFAISTIVTYVVLCVYSTAGLRRVKMGSFEKYGEVISGAFIALVGVVFLIFPVL